MLKTNFVFDKQKKKKRTILFVLFWWVDKEKPRGKHVEETWRVRVGREDWQKSRSMCFFVF